MLAAIVNTVDRASARLSGVEEDHSDELKIRVMTFDLVANNLRFVAFVLEAKCCLLK